MHDSPPAQKVADLSFSYVDIQQSVQNLVWEWDAKPPILWVAGLLHMMATRMIRMRQPVSVNT